MKQDDGHPKHEHRDANARNLFLIALGLIGLIGGMLALMYGLLVLLEENPPPPLNPPSPMDRTQIIPPEPRLQVNPPLDLELLLAREDSVLNGYGWEDEKAGVARIPIDRAIERIIQTGLPLVARENSPGRMHNDQRKGVQEK